MPHLAKRLKGAFFAQWEPWRQQLAHTGQRRLLLLSGEQSWAMAQAQQLINSQPCLWLGEAPTGQAAYPIKQFASQLGHEHTHLVFNAYSGLHPDAFGAATGTLMAGGVLILICPPLADWPTYADPDLVRYVAQPEQAQGLNSRFLVRFIKQLRRDPTVLIWSEGDPPPKLPAIAGTQWQLQIDPQGCLNSQQRHALANILCSVRQSQPLVLTADRGRGKSSVLGLAAERLMKAGVNLALTAPNKEAAAQVLTHCSLPLSFIAPDALVAQQPQLSVLLIDEAAAIPAPMLLIMAKRYCCVFATTEHGYEGTGLGFQLKFQPALQQLFPKWRKVVLSLPARWSLADPVEPLLYRLLALHAKPPAPSAINKLSHRWITREQLLKDDTLLQSLFGLLTLAHYQTRPSDLRHLLDAPQLLLAVTFNNETPIAIALLIMEGGITGSLSQAIWRGQRRPRGHLLAQSLSFHGGIYGAERFTYLRVMRIVVHPNCQQQGIGSQLLSWLQTTLSNNGQVDFLGASFGASAELLEFWHRNHFKLVRLGLLKDGVSGLHAAMMLWPCSEAAQQALPHWQQVFNANLADYRHGPLAELNTKPWPPLFMSVPPPPPEHDRRIAHDVAFYHRDWISDQPALVRFTQRQAPLKPLSPSQAALLTDLLTPGVHLGQLAKRYQFSGYKELLRHARWLLQHFFIAPQYT